MRTRPHNSPPSQSPAGGTSGDGWPLKIFAFLFGAFLGLALLKFPNPPVVEHLITPPANEWEFALMAWPVRYAYPLAAILGLAGFALMRWPAGVPKLLPVLPLVWFGWMLISAGQSIEPKLSNLTLLHFGVGLVCFYLGLLVVSRAKGVGWLFAGVIAAFAVIVAVGWEQQLGGLEASRKQMLEEYAKSGETLPPELLKRLEGGRIFSTLFYANSLAGALLLLTPLMLGLIAEARERFTSGARWLLGVVVGGTAVACLVWTKSKGGWLLAVGMLVVLLFQFPLRRQLKIAVIGALLLAGGAGFVVRFAGFLQKGAPSVVQRFNYWNAAAGNVAARPILGSGPGTFGKVYARVKPPEAEMARLTHNDYLQQASDSGVIAGGIFLGWVGWVLVWTQRVSRRAAWMRFGLWLGLAGFAAQAFIEFGFYVPATCWCWFGLAGWLVGSAGRAGIGFDNPKPAA